MKETLKSLATMVAITVFTSVISAVVQNKVEGYLSSRKAKRSHHKKPSSSN